MAGRDTNLFVQEMQDELKCPICLVVFNDPVDTPCGHSFCRECILANLIEMSGVCPLDREPIQIHSLKPSSHLVRSLLSRLIARCDHCAEAGNGDTCAWQGEWSLLPTHLSKECGFVMVKCKYNCETYTIRKDIASHEITCENRPITCTHCSKTIHYKDILNHEGVCPMFLVECDQGCGTQVPRYLLQEHIKQLCPQTIVHCTYSEFGCNHKLKRKLAAEHEEKNSVKHTNYMANYMLKQKQVYQQDLAAKSQQIHTLQQQVLQMQQSLLQTEQKLKITTDQVQQLRTGEFIYEMKSFSDKQTTLVSPMYTLFGHK